MRDVQGQVCREEHFAFDQGSGPVWVFGRTSSLKAIKIWSLLHQHSATTGNGRWGVGRSVAPISSRHTLDFRMAQKVRKNTDRDL